MSNMSNKTIRERALKLKSEAIDLKVFSLQLPESRKILNELAMKYLFEGAVITNSQLKNITIITKNGHITI